MLTEIETARTTLNQEFKTALVGIKRYSKQMQDAERLELDDVRRLAGDINRTAGGLDRLIEDLVDTETEDGARVEVAQEVPVAESAVVAGRGTY